MFGSLILPTGGVRGGTRTGCCIHPSPSRYQLSAAAAAAMGSTPNYHPTMMSFPSSRNTKSPRRIRAASSSSSSSFTAETLPLCKPNINTTLNLYQILRIKHNASSLEIKTAYRKLAKQFHPDASLPKSTSDDDDDGGRDFMEIHNAYSTLSDPTERARYDLSIQIQSRNSSSHRRYYSSTSASASASVDGNENRSYGMQTRRWETDQCW